MKLTDKTVAVLALDGKKDAIHFDDSLTGFGYRLRQGAGGRVLRTWIVQYRRAGASRRMLIGSAEVVTADQARAKAKKVLAAVALGHDPQAEKAERRTKDRVTMRAVVGEYCRQGVRLARPNTARRRALSHRPILSRVARHGRRQDHPSRRCLASRRHQTRA
jgi:hypothetical protein